MNKQYSSANVGLFVVSIAAFSGVVTLAHNYYKQSSLPQPPKKELLNKPKCIVKTVTFHYRGWQITCVAEKKYFKRNKLISDLQKTIKWLEDPDNPNRPSEIKPVHVVMNSSYSPYQLSITQVCQKYQCTDNFKKFLAFSDDKNEPLVS